MQRLVFALLLIILPSCHSKLVVNAYYDTDIDEEKCFCPSIELQVLEQLKKDRKDGLVISPYAIEGEKEVNFFDDLLGDSREKIKKDDTPSSKDTANAAESNENNVNQSQEKNVDDKQNAQKKEDNKEADEQAQRNQAKLIYNREKRIINKSILQESVHVDVARAIILWATELKYDRHLHYQDGCIVNTDLGPLLRLEFINQDSLELGQARDLLVDTTEGLIERLANTSFPASIEQLEIVIDFETYQGLYVDPYFIGYIWLENGIAHFYAFDTKDRDLDFWDSRVEAYSNTKNFVQFHREGEELYKKNHKPARKNYLSDERFLE